MRSFNCSIKDPRSNFFSCHSTPMSPTNPAHLLEYTRSSLEAFLHSQTLSDTEETRNKMDDVAYIVVRCHSSARFF